MPNRLISRANGVFSDTAPWSIAATAGAVDSETAIQNVGAGEVSTPNFTPGVITTDGVAMKLGSVTTQTGTVTVTLRNVTLSLDVTSVTINATDLPSSGVSWIFFKWPSPELLLAATDYCIKIVCSTGSIGWYRTSTSGDFSKLISTDATASPAAGDQLLILGEHTGAGTSNSFTITMDWTDSSTVLGATTYTDSISVNNKGTLSLDTGSSLDYAIKYVGRFSVFRGGIVNFGTSGTRVDATSTMTLIMSVASNVDTGLVVQNGGTFNAYGQTITAYQTLLNTDESAGATVLGVASTSGWAANGEIAIASTTRTSTQHEKRTISTVDSSTQVTVTSGLTNAHSGTSPTQAEVIYLTRNVKIRGTSATLQGYVWFDDTSTVVCDSVEFSWLGSATTNKRGVDIQTTTGSCTITGCSFHEFSVASAQFITVTGSSSNNISIANSVFWSCSGGNGISWSTTTGSTLSINNCTVIGAGNTGFNIADSGVSISNAIAASCVGAGFNFTGAGVRSTAVISSLTAHSNGSYGIGVSSISFMTINTVLSWRNASYGVYFFSVLSWENVIDGVTAFGNSTANVSTSDGHRNTIKNLVSSGDTTFSTTTGVAGESPGTGSLVIENSTFGVVSGIKTAHAQDVLLSGNARLVFRDCLFASSTEVSVTVTNADYVCGIFSQKHDNTAGLHKRYTVYGNAVTETTTYKTASPSEKLSPLSSTVKFRSSVMQCAVVNGNTATISVYVQKNATYNGASPRLILEANPSAGIDSDVVLDTFSVGNDTWEQLSGTTAAVNDDCVLSFYVDCSGTAGSIFVDDFSVS